MDSLTVTREQFRLAKKDELEFLAQALGNVSGSYNTQTISPTAVTLQGAPTLAAGAEPAADDESLRLVNTRWVKRNAASTGTTAPVTPVRGQVWIDTSQDPPAMKVWDDTPPPGAWVPVAPTVSVPDATETAKGIVELATAAETTAGTDATRAVHPAGLKVELDKKLSLAGGALTGSITTPERTITAGAFDLATGPYWTCGAIAIPNPTNAVSGMSGLIRLTAAPTSWAANFKFEGGVAPAVSTVPAIVPFYVESTSVIRMGQPVVVG